MIDKILQTTEVTVDEYTRYTKLPTIITFTLTSSKRIVIKLLNMSIYKGDITI